MPIIIPSNGGTTSLADVGARGAWAQPNEYTVDQLVTKDGLLYAANGVIPAGTAFVEGTTAATWREVSIDYTKLPDHDPALNYKLNEAVVFEGRLYRATVSHSAAAFSLTNFEEISVADVVPEWVAGTTYLDKDLVKQGNQIYRSTGAGNLGNDPNLDTAEADWVLIGSETVTGLRGLLDAITPIRSGVLVTGSGGSLTLTTTAGSFDIRDGKSIVNTAFNAHNPLQFDLYDVNGLVSAAQTSVPVAVFDDGGTPAAILNNDAANWRLYANPIVADEFALLYPQETYNTVAMASRDLAVEAFILPVALNDWAEVARFSAAGDSAHLGDVDHLLNTDKFGQVGSSIPIPVMVGSTAELDGTSGLTPTPVAGEQDKFLGGDGEYTAIMGAAHKTAIVRQGLSATTAGDMAFIVVMGQSNAMGRHGLSPAVAPNVFVMPRGTRTLAPYSNTNSNVVDTEGSDHANPLTSIAEEWQARIDGGEALPDLAIINISLGGRGVGKTAADNPWNPDLINSAGGTWPIAGLGVSATNHSLYALADEAIRAAVAEIEGNGNRPVHLATIWNQWEKDSQADQSAEEYPINIRRIRKMVDEALNIDNASFVCWNPTSLQAPVAGRRDHLSASIIDMVDSETNVYLLDPRQAPNYTGTGAQQGIFFDEIHYLGEVQQWAAQQIVADILDNDVIVARTASVAPAVATPSGGIDDVLAQDQSLTADRTVDLAGNDLMFDQDGNTVALVSQGGLQATRTSDIITEIIHTSGAAHALPSDFGTVRIVADATTADMVPIATDGTTRVDRQTRVVLWNVGFVERVFQFSSDFLDTNNMPLGDVTVAVGESRTLLFHNLPTLTSMKLMFDSSGMLDRTQPAGRMNITGSGFRNRFDLDQGYVSQIGDAMTYSLWFMPEEVQANPIHTLMLVGLTGESANTNSQMLIQNVNGTYSAGWEHSAGVNNYVDIPNFVPVYGQLNHVAAVMTTVGGTTTMSIYLNGVLTDTLSGPETDGSVDPRLWVGCAPTNSRSMSGLFSHMTVWREELEASEIARLAHVMPSLRSPQPLPNRSATYYNNFDGEHGVTTLTGVYATEVWEGVLAPASVGAGAAVAPSGDPVRVLLGSGLTTNGGSVAMLPTFTWDSIVAAGYSGIEVTAHESKTNGAGSNVGGTKYYDASLFTTNAATGSYLDSVGHANDNNYLWFTIADVTTGDGQLSATGAGAGGITYTIYGIRPQQTVIDATNVVFSYTDAASLLTSDMTVGVAPDQYTVMRSKRTQIGNKVTLTYHFTHYERDAVAAFTVTDIAVINSIQITRDAVIGTTQLSAVRTSDVSFTIDRANALDGSSPFFVTIEGDAV